MSADQWTQEANKALVAYEKVTGKESPYPWAFITGWLAAKVESLEIERDGFARRAEAAEKQLAYD